MRKGLAPALTCLALTAGFFLVLNTLLGYASFSLSFVIVVLTLGFAFVAVQGYRRTVSYRTRLASSAISMAMAGYFIAAGVDSFLTRPIQVSLFSVVYLLLALSFVRSDMGMWRWFCETRL